MKDEKKKSPGKKKKGLSKKFRHSTLSVILTVVVIAAVVLANAAATLFFDRYPLTVDMTSEKRYTISEQSLEYIKTINTDVQVTVFADESSFTNFNYPYNKQAAELLKNYCRENHHISYRFIDMDKNPDVARSYTDVRELDIIFETTTTVNGEKMSRTRKVGAADLVNFEDRLVQSLSNSGFTIESYSRKNLEGSQAQFIQYFSSYIESSNAESAFTSALMAVTDPKPVTVAFLTGRSELGDLNYFKSLLEANGYNIITVDITKEDIPQNTDIAVLPAPQTDYMQADADKLDKFMQDKDKHLVCFSHAAQQSAPILGKILAKYGLAVGEGVICETKTDRYYNEPYYTLANEVSEYLSLDMDSKDPQILIAQSRPVNTVDTSSSAVKTQLLITSSDTGYTADTAALVNGETKVLENAKQCYAAMSTDSSSGNTVVLFGTSSIAEDQFMAYGQYSNRDLMLTLFNKMTGKKASVKIEPKVIESNAFDITESEKKVLKWVFILVVPIAVAVTGIVICVRRKRR